MKALVGAFNQEKALVGAFSVIVQPVVEPMDRFTALLIALVVTRIPVTRQPVSRRCHTISESVINILQSPVIIVGSRTET